MQGDLFVGPTTEPLRVIVGMEASGEVREAFRELGHDAWSCDLREAEDGSPYHLQGDVFGFLEPDRWDLGIFHPTCTYLCSSGLHWNKRIPGRAEKTEAALEDVRRLMAAPIPRIAIENPVGCIGTRIRPADQYIQPHEFGHDASKRTGLWLKGLPKLVADPADYVEPRWVDGKPRWANQTDSGQNKLGPTDDHMGRTETLEDEMWARIDWTRTGLDFVDEAKSEHQEDLARLNAVYGDDWVDGWPMDNSDEDVVVTRKGPEFDFQRAVLVRGVKVGWVSRLGGYGDKPVTWEAYLRNPGEVKGIAVRNDSSKLRYAVGALVQAAAQESARAARYLLQDYGYQARQEVAR